MNKIIITIFTFMIVITAVPASALPISLGVAGEYNTFVFNDFQSTSDTEGRLAVGGNAHLSSYSVGLQLEPNSGDVLVVGGNLQFDGGNVFNGDARVGGSVTGVSYDFTNDGELYTNADMPFDFEAEQERLTNLSLALSGLEANGDASYYWSGMHLTTDSDDNIKVFNISGDELLASSWLEVAGISEDDTVIFNVSGETAGLRSMGLDVLAPFSSNILFNFYEATNLELMSVGVWGSILAPYADVAYAQGVIHGTLIASSFEGSMQQNYNPFSGTPVATPEPGSVLLMGLGLLSLLALRKKIKN